MTGDRASELFEEAMDKYLGQFPPRERHKRERGLRAYAEEAIRAEYGEHVLDEFRDARSRAAWRQ